MGRSPKDCLVTVRTAGVMVWDLVWDRVVLGQTLDTHTHRRLHMAGI